MLKPRLLHLLPFLLAPALIGATEPVAASTPPSPFHNSVELRYNYAFGHEGPFLPSNATTTDGRFMNPRSVPTADYCGHCHKESYHQWRESVHSNSFHAPWYLKNVNALIAEKGVQYSRHCEGCHNPVALFSGDLSQGMPKKRPFEDEGISCAVCHSIEKVNNTGTGSYVMGTPAVLLDEAGKPITRPVTDAEILSHLERHSAAVMKPFYRTSEFCAACHKAAIPRMLNDYKWQRAFTVYDEWQAASFTKQSPLPFYRKDTVSTCQTCHMQREALAAGAVEPGAKNGQLVSHRWLGGNSLLPAYYNFDEQSRKLAAFLKNGVLNVDIFALEKEDAAATRRDQVLVAPLGMTNYSIAVGETLVADVVIQNKGIAHSLVPEQRDFYEAWVDFTVKDAAGRTLVESGYIKPDGALDPEAHSFTNRLINVEGGLNGLHEIWHNRVIAYNNTIQSGRSQLVRYRFRLPKSLTGSFQLTATVRYRRFNQRFLDYAFEKQHTEEPILEIASTTRTINIGDNHPTTALEGQNPEWMRWNNYGIALLDAVQYEASVAAFEHVALLRPDYADAYTNMAIVENAWERYDDARPNLEKALKLLPNDARALYYRALVERNAGDVAGAVRDLENVVGQYPLSKDGLRELGYSYLQLHDYAHARSYYERLQAIDPDDLAAHYELAILYRRLGEKQKAAVESAKFADQKDDAPASAYALEYLRKHPEIAAESVAWHAHDLTGDPPQPAKPIQYKYIPGAGF